MGGRSKSVGGLMREWLDERIKWLCAESRVGFVCRQSGGTSIPTTTPETQVDTYVPKDVWELPLLMRQTPQAEIDRQWKALLMSPHPKVHRNGQWCVYKFDGVRVETYQDRSNERRAQKVLQAHTISELQGAMAEGSRVLSESATSFERSAAAVRGAAVSGSSRGADVPRELVQGSVEFADSFAGGAEEIAQSLWEMEMRSVERQNQEDELARQMDLDIEVFKQEEADFVKTALTKTMTAFEVQQEKAKFKVLVGEAASKVKASLEGLVAEGSEVRTFVVAHFMDEKLYGKGTDFGNEVERLDEIEKVVPEIGKALDEQVVAIKKEIDDIGEHGKVAQKLVGDLIKNMRKSVSASSAPLEKILRDVRSMIKLAQNKEGKVTKRKAGKMSVATSNDPDGPSSTESLEYLRFHLCEQKKASGLEKNFAQARLLGKPFHASDPKVAAAILELPICKATLEYIKPRVADGMATASVSQTAHRSKLEGMLVDIVKCGSQELFGKLLDMASGQKNKQFNELWWLNFTVREKGTAARGLAPYGLAYGCFVLEGSMLFAGVLFSKVDGNALPDKIRNLRAMSPGDLSKLVSDEGFCSILSVGSMLVAPPGYILLHFCDADTVSMTWSSCPSGAGACPSSVSTSVSMATELCTAYPSIRTPRMEALLLMLRNML